MPAKRGKKLRAEMRIPAYRRTVAAFLANKRNELNNQVSFLNTCLKELEQEVTRLTTPVNNKYPALSEGSVKKLNKLYTNALAATSKIKSIKGGFFGKSSKLRLMQRIAEKTETMLASDLRALTAAGAGMGMTLVEALENSRNNVIDVSNVELKKVGGSQSSRLTMTIKSPSGFKKAGLFTKEENYRKFAATNAYLEKLADLSPQPLKNVIKNCKLPINSDRAKVYNTFNFFAAATSSNLDNMEIALGLPAGFLKDSKNITSDELNAFLETIKQTGTELNKAYVKDSFAYSGQNLSDGANIDDRNVSMSAVANLLGKSNLLANSVPMTIVSNGVETRGTFMEFATGYMDIVHPKENDLVFSAKFPEALDGSPGLKAAAELQIIDYICGNLDRHLGNVFYDFKKDKNGHIVLAGVKGIDNDGSFTSYNIGQGIAQLAGLDNLKVISREMADTIMSITPEHISMVLKGAKLGGKEVEEAEKRFNQIKDVLQNPQKHAEKIQIIEDKDWAKVKIKDLLPAPAANGLQRTNIFSQINSAFQPNYIEAMKQWAKQPNAAKQGQTEVDLHRQAVKVDYKKAEEKINNVVQGLEDARLWLRGSEQYQNMLVAARAFKAMLQDYNSNKVPNMNIEKNFKQMLDVMKDRTEKYIDLKTGRDKPSAVSSNTSKRILAAYDALDFVHKFSDKREASLREDYHLQNFEEKHVNERNIHAENQVKQNAPQV